MTKSDLVSVVSEKAGMTKKDAEAAVNATFDAITDAMKKGDKVQISGFGIFSSKERKARTCINPATKEKIEVKATTVPSFKAGKGLKDIIAK